MIFYSPTDGVPFTGMVEYSPRTCFLMTKLGDPIPKEVIKIRSHLTEVFSDENIMVIDANDIITGGDFHLKIFKNLANSPGSSPWFRHHF